MVALAVPPKALMVDIPEDILLAGLLFYQQVTIFFTLACNVVVTFYRLKHF